MITDEFNSRRPTVINYILTGEGYIAFHFVLPTWKVNPLICDKGSNNDMT
jgi:hypothetical protein